MKRFLILNGDKTTANGIVQATPTSIQLSDKDVAHEGDKVACPACNTVGKIQCDLPRIYGILSAYNKGLDELRRGYRCIWRRDEAFDQALTDYHVVAKYLYPDGDYWERGIQEAPYPPKVEALNLLMRGGEYVGEHA